MGPFNDPQNRWVKLNPPKFTPFKTDAFMMLHWLVVEPTHLKNMPVKLDIFPNLRGENKKYLKPLLWKQQPFSSRHPGSSEWLQCLPAVGRQVETFDLRYC